MQDVSNIDIVEFTRSKIYEQLDFVPEPANYNSKMPWTVQLQIAATNGIHYVDRVGKLKDYPKYELPVMEVTGEKLMLDIGCGWGRWLSAGSRKGYIPIGADLRLEFCQTALKVLNDQNVNGYAVVADLENLPFKTNTFDLIWSFSVIQHTHRERLNNCLQHINRLLKPDGFTCLEFPNKKGFRNSRGPVKSNRLLNDDYNSWMVRYYTPDEYQQYFNQYFQSFEYDVHSFLGIGVLKEDLKYVSFKNKILCAASLVLTGTAKLFPILKDYADSLYISAKKKQTTIGSAVNNSVFFEAHKNNPSDNLNIISMIQCPKSGGDLELSKDRKRVISKEAGLYYPVVDDIPILIASEAKSL